MTRPRRAAPRSLPRLLRPLTHARTGRVTRAALAGATVVALGVAAAGGTSSISMAGHVIPQGQHSAADAAHSHSHDAHGDLPPAFARRAEAVSRDAGRPALDASTTASSRDADASAAPKDARAARLARERAEVAQERTEAAFAARTSRLSKEAADTDKAAKAAKARQVERALHRHVFPLHHSHIVATFGAVGPWARYHTGIDFSAPLGTAIHAAAAGVVTHVGPGGGAGGWAGSYVTIKHAGGYQTLYAHMNPAIVVSVGQHVSAGQLIGHVGLTGRTFGPHCHFELYPPGVEPGDVYQAIDPMPWLEHSGTTS